MTSIFGGYLLKVTRFSILVLFYSSQARVSRENMSLNYFQASRETVEDSLHLASELDNRTGNWRRDINREVQFNLRLIAPKI